MYPQFIYGKFVSRTSDYELVAHSAELANKEDLINMVQKTHRFWGQTEPGENVRALGIFLQNNNLVLFKAQSAKDQNGLFAVNGERGFVQFRYVFIPTTSTSVLQGRVFKLIDWMSKQPIPLLTEFNANLEPFSIPVLEEIISTETIDKEIEKIRQCWPDSNEQKPLFLSALALIINGKRVLLTNEQKDAVIWRDSILILLPASIRSQISLAVGILDEEECPWATLVVKVNKHSSRSLPDNMIWLNRTNQTFERKFDENILNNAYVDYIYDHIKTFPDRLKELIEQLDRINDDISLDSLADPKIIPKIIIRLIEVLPDEKQEDFLKKYLPELTISQWEELIPIIIKENYQQGLVFAWEELGKEAILTTEAIRLMFQVWSNLVSEKLILLLDELNNNLKLAEILLKDNLLLDKSLELLSSENSQHLSQAIYSVTVEKLIALCKYVVANKAKSNFLEAWEFTTNLVNHHIFDNQTEKFLLIDTSFLGEISNNQNLLNLTPVIDLLPHINIETFKSSNLHKKLTEKNREVRDLLINVLEEKNKSLAKLSSIAKLAKISDKEDGFYITFLKPWSPSIQEANTLLVEIIKNDQSSNENKIFSLDRLYQTYNWFEEKQPTFKSIFDELQQNYNCENWYKLAQTIYESEEEQLKFIDVIVGKIFPVEVIQKWLPLIAEHESVRKNFIDNSSAWKNITTEKFNQLVNSSEQYISTLTRCLRDSSRQNWIQGNLLHFLCESWIKQNRVDDDLKNVITSPDVTITFTTKDWLILQRLSWKTRIELPLGVKTSLTPDQKNSLLKDAKNLVLEYTEPVQIQKLVSDCQGWGLNLSECKEILKEVKNLSSCNVDLITPYLYINDKVINPMGEWELIKLLLKLQLKPEEKSYVKQFSVDVFTQYILHEQNISFLEVWQRTAVEQEVYKEAFSQASQIYVQNISTNDIRNCLEKLKQYNNNKLFEEFRLMLKAMFNFIGIPDRAIQSIIDDL